VYNFGSDVIAARAPLLEVGRFRLYELPSQCDDRTILPRGPQREVHVNPPMNRQHFAAATAASVRRSDALTPKTSVFMTFADATLALVALMASLVPAYRALRLDPVKALRGD